MGKGDVSHLSFREICEFCTHISRGKYRTGKNLREHVMSRINKSATWIVSTTEICNLIDKFKTNILISLSEQIDNLKIQNKKKHENVALSIFYHKCRKKHALRECLLDSVEICVIYAKGDNTKRITFNP